MPSIIYPRGKKTTSWSSGGFRGSTTTHRRGMINFGTGGPLKSRPIYGHGKDSFSHHFVPAGGGGFHSSTRAHHSSVKITNVNVTKAAGAAAVIGGTAYGGYKAYQHRDEIKQKASQMHDGIHNAFHSTHHMLGAH